MLSGGIVGLSIEIATSSVSTGASERYRMARAGSKEDTMARGRLGRVAVKIGRAIGKADRKAHQVAKAGLVAKEELEDIGKQVEALKRQLQKTTRRLRKALS